MDFEHVMQELANENNLNTEAGRKAAYRRFLERARADEPDPSEFNRLCKKVAEALGQMPVRLNILESLPVDGGEILYLTYRPDVGPELTGNHKGLEYLEKALALLRRSGAPGDHFHLRPGNELHGQSYLLNVYYEPDEWFEKNIGDRESTSDDESDIPRRNVDPSSVDAFIVLREPPPTLALTKNKVYKVTGVRKYSDDGVWMYGIRESTERIFVFQYVNDDGKEDNIAFDLDDTDVLLLGRDELGQVNFK